MSKILFVENRFRTETLNPLAIALQWEGHKILWFIEKHAFASLGEYSKVFVISYPSRKNLNKVQEYHAQMPRNYVTLGPGNRVTPTVDQLEKWNSLRLLNRTSYADKSNETLTQSERFERVMTAMKVML